MSAMTRLGEVIRTARIARGMTQMQLSKQTGITQAALSCYENDLREPEPDAVEKIALALGLTAGLLMSAGRMHGSMAVGAHMRRRATAGATVWRRLEAKCNLYRLHLRAVNEHVFLRASSTVCVFDLLETSPEAAARMLRMQWRMPIGPVHNLIDWMESAGCVIFDEPFGSPRVDGMSQWIEDCPVILLNSEMPTDRRRWTLAHELGHLCLHSKHITDTAEQDIEQEANNFAAEFLMPADVIGSELRNLSLGKLSDLKRKWHVSMQALIERAYRLRRITKPQRTQLYKRLSSLGWRRQEPLSDQLVPEKPTLIAEIGRTLREQGLSDTEIAAIVGISADYPENPFLPENKPRLRVI